MYVVSHCIQLLLTVCCENITSFEFRMLADFNEHSWAILDEWLKIFERHVLISSVLPIHPFICLYQVCWQLILIKLYMLTQNLLKKPMKALSELNLCSVTTERFGWSSNANWYSVVPDSNHVWDTDFPGLYCLWFSPVPPSRCLDSTLNYAMSTSRSFPIYFYQSSDGVCFEFLTALLNCI
jgi:hypothetical protein